MASTKDVKRELSRRVDIVTQPRCLESQIRPYLRAEAGVNGDWQTRVVQLDGTGAATIEIGLGGQQRVFAKLYPDESGPLIYEKLKTLRACGFGPGERHQAVEPLGFIPEYGMLLTRALRGCQYPRTSGLMRRRCWPVPRRRPYGWRNCTARLCVSAHRGRCWTRVSYCP